MMLKQTLAGAALALALLPGAAPAQSAGGLFDQLDSNGDGMVDRAEFLQLRVTMFETIDADGSGTITAAEIETARQSRQGQRQAQADKRIWSQDANKDGLLTLTEYTAQTRGFDAADRNNDGALSAAEFNRVARFLASAQP